MHSHSEHQQGHEGHGDHNGHEGNKSHDHHDHHTMMVADFKRRFWISMALSIPILFLSPLIQRFLELGDWIRFSGDTYVLFSLSTVVFFYGGWPFLKGLFEELRSLTPGMMTLIAVAISTAYIYSSAIVFGLDGKMFFWELATLIDVMLVGHWIEMRSVMGASRALEELARLMPSLAHRFSDDGNIVDVPLADLLIGDKVLVKPGEKIPADGEVVDGTSSVDESMLTGESIPVSKSPGATAIGGSINGQGSITVLVQKIGKDSFLSQVIDLVREAQASKSQTQDLANRAAVWLTLVALGGGAATMFYWYGIAAQDFAFALERTVTVMVIACPHALGLAIPLVVAVSTSLGARNGLLIRDRTAFEVARKLDTIIFDKTGTLTQGKFGVTDVLLFTKSVTKDELLQFASSVESHSEHPIAGGVIAASPEPPPVSNFRAIPGQGAEGIVLGRSVRVVSPGYLTEHRLTVSDERIDKLSAQGKTVVFVVINGIVDGAIALADLIRPESRETILTLRKMGIRTVMLTGDNKQVAKWVSDEIGLDDYFAEVLPNQKSERVSAIKAQGHTVAMTGDGVNDAPALAQADVGIAIGAGTDVAVETADIVLVRSDPRDVVAIIRLSRATYKKMIQNLWWAAGYNIIAIPIAAGVLYNYGILMGPAAGAALMSVSTVVVAINARRLRL